jgi:hypothetical protein
LDMRELRRNRLLWSTILVDCCNLMSRREEELLGMALQRTASRASDRPEICGGKNKLVRRSDHSISE